MGKIPLLSTEMEDAIELVLKDGVAELNRVIHARPGDDLQRKADRAEGGQLVLAPGEYILPDTLNFGSDTWIRGAGKGVTVLKAGSGLNGRVLSRKTDQLSNAILEGFTVDGNRAKSGSTQAVRFSLGGNHCAMKHVEVLNSAANAVQGGGESFYMMDVDIDNAGNSGYVGGGQGARFFDVSVTNSDLLGFSIEGDDCTAIGITAEDNDGTGINLEALANSTVQGFKAVGNGSGAPQNVAINGGQNVTLRDGLADNSAVGGDNIRIFPLSSATHGHVVENVEVINAGNGTGVTVRADANNPIRDVLVRDCDISDAQNGIKNENSGGGITNTKSIRNEFSNVSTPHRYFDARRDHFLSVIDGVAYERTNAEEPQQAWPDGTMVRFEDSGDGSGTGHYYITRGGSPVQLA